MVERISALKGHYEPGRYGEPGEAGVTVHEITALVMHQLAAWPESIETVAAAAARAAATDAAPGPARAAAGDKGHLLRVEPLKWWLLGADAPELAPDSGTVLDISHSRTRLRVGGPAARACLSRLLPVDLRDGSFPVNSVATTSMHHVAVTIWRPQQDFEVFLPRGFAVSLWETLRDTAVQFGVEVR